MGNAATKSGDQTDNYGDLYELLVKLTANSLKADYYFSWLTNEIATLNDLLVPGYYRDDDPDALIREGALEALSLEKLLGTAKEKAYTACVARTNILVDKYIEDFSPADTEQLLLCAYQTDAGKLAVERLEALLQYFDRRVKTPHVRAVGSSAEAELLQSERNLSLLAQRLVKIELEPTPEDVLRALQTTWARQRIGAQDSPFEALSITYRAHLEGEVPLIPVRIYCSDTLAPGMWMEDLWFSLRKLTGLESVASKSTFGSWLGEFWAVIAPGGTKKEVEGATKKIKRSLDLKYLDKPQAESDAAIINAVAALSAAANENHVFVAQIGSLLFLKLTQHDGKTKVLTRTLTQEQMAFMLDNPELMAHTETLLTELAIPTQELLEVANDEYGGEEPEPSSADQGN